MVHSLARKVTAVAVATAVTLTFVGCASGSNSGDGELTGDIRILANITPVLTTDYYENLVAPYLDAHPGVKVIIETPSGDNVQSTLQQELASGSIPDIVAGNLDPVVVPQLTGFPDEEWVNATPLSQENKVDGKVWQVATGTQIQSLVFYNKDAFAAAGITELPTSLDEFTADLSKLKDAGYVPLQTAGEWVTGAQFAMFANPGLLADGPEFWADETEGKATFVDSAYETYLNAQAGWVKDGLVQQDALGLKYQDSIDGFTSGKAATYVMGNWIVPSIDDANVPFDVGVFATPSLDGSLPKQMSTVAQPYSVLQGSKHQALALDIVKFLVSDKETVLKSLASEGNFRAGFSYDASPLNAAVAEVLDAAPGSVTGTSGPGIPAGFGDQLNLQVQGLYTGATPADAAKALDAWWKSNAAS